MKRKPKLGPRNPLVAPSLFRKAGAHEKTFKAQRRADKMMILQRVAQWAERNQIAAGWLNLLAFCRDTFLLESTRLRHRRYLRYNYGEQRCFLRPFCPRSSRLDFK